MNKPTRPNVIVGHVIQAARKKTGMTQRELGIAAGYTSAIEVGTFERGTRGLTLEQAKRFCPLIGLDPDRMVEIRAMAKRGETMATKDLLLYARGADVPYQPPVVITKSYDELDEEERLRSAAISYFRRLLAQTALHPDGPKRFAAIALLLDSVKSMSTEDLVGLTDLVK
jgi:transcriptional regulator with XRE-family HTH domain